MRELTNAHMMGGEEREKLNSFVANMWASEKPHNNKAKTDSYTLVAKLITEPWVTK